MNDFNLAAQILEQAIDKRFEVFVRLAWDAPAGLIMLLKDAPGVYDFDFTSYAEVPDTKEHVDFFVNVDAPELEKFCAYVRENISGATLSFTEYNQEHMDAAIFVAAQAVIGTPPSV